MNTITLKDLSKEERAALIAEAQADEAAKKELQQENRKAYKVLAAQHVPELYGELLKVSHDLSKAKARIFNELKDLIHLKAEAYGTKEGQQSHTISSENGDLAITIGYRIVDNWDDTLNAGIEKVNSFLGSLGVDENTAKLVKAINRLLQKDANGNLKSSRVLELEKIAEDFNSDLLNDGIEIIRKAYSPAKTCYFVEARYTDKTGKKQNLPLSLSSVDFPEGTEITFM